MTEGFVRVLRGKLLVAVGCVALGVGAVGWAQAPAALLAAQAGDVHARGDIAGDWQGTLQAERPLRLVLRVTKGDKGWSGKLFIITDQGAQPVNVSGLTFDGAAIKFSVDQMGASYEGTVSADGSSMVGTMTGGPGPQPLTLVRATKETAWEIPPPPAPPKVMAADAKPGFEVATIKPNDSGAAQLQGLNVSGNGHNFTTRNSSLTDLIAFAYNVQPKQIIGAPDWMDKDRFDIAAISDTEGMPNGNQLKSHGPEVVGGPLEADDSSR